MWQIRQASAQARQLSAQQGDGLVTGHWALAHYATLRKPGPWLSIEIVALFHGSSTILDPQADDRHRFF